MPRLLERRPLRADVARDVAERIVSGELSPGTRLKDTVVAAELGVSRTPVREALVELVQRGLLEADAGRGFAVAPLRREEIIDGYPILWTLESLALALSPPADVALLDTLETCNTPFAVDAMAPEERLAADDAFHDALLSRCPNRTLRRLTADAKQRVRRYEYAYALARAPRVSHAEHAAIIAALRTHDAAGARAALEANWRGTMDALLAHITA